MNISYRSSLLAVASVAVLWACGDDFNSPPTVASLAVTPSPASGVADGSSVVTLVATIDPTTAPGDAHVVFSTTIGTFLGGTSTVTATADGTGAATAQLKAPSSPGTAIVTAMFAGLTKSLQIQFAASPSTKGVKN